MAQGKDTSDSTSAGEKPVNPLEREERVGIQDGSDHAGEQVTTIRHGIANAPSGAQPGSSAGTESSRDPSGTGAA